MEHYICTGGCKGVSNKPGFCQNKTCPQYQEPLEPCDCTDNAHYGAFDLGEDLEDENANEDV